MDDFDFGFEVQNENNALGNALWMLIRIFALTFSALTTAAFFWRYVGDAFDFIFGDWSPYVTAAAGMIALDGLSQAWAHVRGHRSDTTLQMAVARFMSWADLMASVIVTVVYLLLNAAFDVGIYTPNGELTQLGFALNVVGVVILVAAIAGNFIAAHLFSDASSGNREAVHNSEMGAMAAFARHRISKQQALLTAEHTMGEIMGVLPEHTRQQATANRDRYIESQFGTVPPIAPPTPPAQAGTPYTVQQVDGNGRWRDRISVPDFGTAQWRVDTWTRDLNDIYRVMFEGRQVYHSRNVSDTTGEPLDFAEKPLPVKEAVAYNQTLAGNGDGHPNG